MISTKGPVNIHKYSTKIVPECNDIPRRNFMNFPKTTLIQDTVQAFQQQQHHQIFEQKSSKSSAIDIEVKQNENYYQKSSMSDIHSITTQETQKNASNNIVDAIQIELNPNADDDHIFETDYGAESERYLIESQPDYSNCLKETSIKKELRARMINWIVEVLGHYFKTTTNSTFFRVVGMMDLFLKNSKKKLKESDIHLVGTACIYIGSKYEDIYHITLKDVVKFIVHNKFTENEIKTKEMEVLKTLGFDLSFSTHLDFLDRIIYKNFQEDDQDVLKQIKNTSIYILKMCLYDADMLNYKPIVLSLAVFFYCIKCYFHSLKEAHFQILNVDDLARQENQLLQNILFGYKDCVDVYDVEDCIFKVRELTLEFQKRYPDLDHLKKFSDL